MPPKVKVTPKRRQASDEPATTPAPVSVSRRTRASVSGPPARDSPSSSDRETPRAARSSRAPASSSRRSQPREEEYIVEKLLDREIASLGYIQPADQPTDQPADQSDDDDDDDDDKAQWKPNSRAGATC